MVNYFQLCVNRAKMFVENLIGSRAKVKILRVLSEVRTAYSLKNLEAETGLSLSIIHKAVEELASEGILIKIKGERKQRLYKFNTESPFSPFIFDLFRIERTRQRKEVVFLSVWGGLEFVLAKIEDKIDLMVLFGSQARGHATLSSDIDLLIIPKKEKFKDSILVSIEAVKIKNKINPLILDLKTFKHDIKDRTPLYQNMKKDGIILFVDKSIKEDISEFLKEIEPKLFSYIG